MKSYVVFIGRKSGVFDSWDECSAQVQGFKGAMFKGFSNRQIVKNEYSKFCKDKGRVNIKHNKPLKGICSDAAYSTSTNILEYRVVNIENSEKLVRGIFKQLKCKHLTNVGEFFGLVRAVKWVIDKKLDTIIFSDSVTAIKWVTEKKVNTSIIDKEVLLMLEKGVKYLEGLDKLPIIVKWQTNLWGIYLLILAGNKIKKLHGSE